MKNYLLTNVPEIVYCIKFDTFITGEKFLLCMTCLDKNDMYLGCRTEIKISKIEGDYDTNMRKFVRAKQLEKKLKRL